MPQTLLSRDPSATLLRGFGVIYHVSAFENGFYSRDFSTLILIFSLKISCALGRSVCHNECDQFTAGRKQMSVQNQSKAQLAAFNFYDFIYIWKA